jgi:uncharacterized OB-fold protein
LLVEIPDADGVRVLGNLIGETTQSFAIGDEVEAVFEDHDDVAIPFTLVQWKQVERRAT